MVARWIQAKKTKMRRAYLKRKVSHGGPHKEGMAELYYNKAKSIGSDTNRLNYLYPGTINQRPTDPWLETRETEKRVQDEETMWQSAWWHGYNQWYQVTLLDARTQFIQLVFSGNRFIILKWDWVRKEVKRSITYNSHRRAINAYGCACDDVAWSEVLPLISKLPKST